MNIVFLLFNLKLRFSFGGLLGVNSAPVVSTAIDLINVLLMKLVVNAVFK